MALGRIFVFFGGLIVLALTAALVVPYFVDWNGYRADFEREAGRVLGRPVTVEGKVSVRLIPFPSVSFSDVRVGDPRKAPLMTIRTFSMDAEISPLLSGKVLIYNMRIDHPHAVLTVDKDGAVDWTIRPSTPFNPKQVTLEKVTITDGSVDIVDNSVGRKHSIDGLNATMSASTLAGPWNMDGTATLDGERAEISVSTNAPAPGEPLRLHARVEPDNLAAVVSTDGSVTVKSGRITYAGTLDIRSADIVPDAVEEQGNAASTRIGGRRSPLFTRLSVTGRFKADHAGIEVPEFQMEQGPASNPYVVNGKARLDYGATPSFAITASGEQILIGSDTSHGADKTKSRPGAGSPFPNRLSAFDALLAAIPIPDIPGTVDLNLPAIIAGGTTVRDVTVKAEPARGGWTINRFAAELPGRTRIEATGKLLAVPGFRFEGSLLVASRQPSGLSTWLTGGVDEAVRRLSGAGFSADVSLSEKTQRFENLEVAIGSTTLKGSFVRRTTGLARPSLQVRLAGGTVDANTLGALRSFLISDHGAPRLSGNDLDVSFKAGPVGGEGLKAGSIDTAFRLSEGRLDIDRLTIGDVAGATLTATGKMMPFKSSPTGSIDATLLAPDLDGLVATAARQFPGLTFFSALRDRAALYPGLLKDSELSVIASAVRNAGGGIEISLSGNGKTGGTTLSFAGQGKGPDTSFGSLDLDVTAEAKNRNGETLLALAGLPTLPLDMIGAMDGEMSLKGRLDDGATVHLGLSAAGTKATIEGKISKRDGAVEAEGKAHLKSEDLDPYLAVTGHALPGFGDGLSADLASDFTLKGGRLALSHLSGAVDGGSVDADLSLLMKQGIPRIEGSARLGRLDLAGVAAFLLGPTAFEADAGAWPETPFSQASSFPLGADVSVSARTAYIAPGAAIQGFSAEFTLDSDDLRISGLKGRLDGGALGGLVELRNSGGTGLASAQLTLSDTDLPTFYRTADGVAPMTGTADISASLNSTGKSVAGLMASLAGSGVVSAKGLTVAGLDPEVFGSILKESDAAGPDVKQATLSAIIGRHFPSGHLAAGNVDLPFTVAAGVVRFSSVRIAAPRADLTATLRADVGRNRLDGSAGFTFEPGPSALSGAEPTVRISFDGPIDQPKTTFDTQPMIQFLTQRALEREQQRVEAMQAALLEKQRLRREVAYFRAQAVERQKSEADAAKAAAQRKAAEEAAKKITAEEAAKRKAAEEAAKRKAAQEAAKKLAAEDAANQKAAEEAKRRKALEAEQEKAIEDALGKTGTTEPRTPPATSPSDGASGGASPGKDKLKFPLTIEDLIKGPQPASNGNF